MECLPPVGDLKLLRPARNHQADGHCAAGGCSFKETAEVLADLKSMITKGFTELAEPRVVGVVFNLLLCLQAFCTKMTKKHTSQGGELP